MKVYQFSDYKKPPKLETPADKAKLAANRYEEIITNRMKECIKALEKNREEKTLEDLNILILALIGVKNVKEFSHMFPESE